MSEPHSINLSTAWEPPSEGSRAWVRRFGRPSGVEPGDQIWLAVDGGLPATLVLNGVCLPPEKRRHDVTAILESRNELLLVPLTPAAPADSSPGNTASSRTPAHGRCDLDPLHGKLRLEIGTGVG